MTSVHLADVGPRAALRVLRRPPRPGRIRGLRWAMTATPTPMGRTPPRPRPGQIGLIAAWDDDEALDAFVAEHHVVQVLDGGYRVRLEPVRIIGAWPDLGALSPAVGPSGDGPAALDGGPAAVLTLGRLRLRRAIGFARASVRAERDAVASPAAVIATALARPPRFVATFSMWSDAAAMREFVLRASGGHAAATREHAANPFHHASAFIRFRPYDEHGAWAAP